MMKALQGVLFVLLVLGSLVYAVYAQVTEPALEPALHVHALAGGCGAAGPTG
jgi:hypothetical protein